jgi:four helix bundle protein
VSHRYQDLIAWQKAKRLATEIYRATESFPKAEMYGLTSQLRRAAVSVPSNIAEGEGRLTKGEFCRGSLLELETQLAIALELEMVEETEHQRLQEMSEEVCRIVNGLIDSMQALRAGAGN